MNAEVIQNCPQCGAVVEGAAMSSACAFCATPLAIAQDVRTLDAPKRLAPFRLNRQQAEDRIARHLRSRWFLHPKLKKATKAESLHPVMVPFYAFNGMVVTQVSADLGIRYTRGSGENKRTYTEWFPDFNHEHVLKWQDHLVSASKGLSEHLSNRLEPFELERALPYDPHLLAGLEAERPAIALEDAEQTARKELVTVGKRRLEQEMFGAMRTRNVQMDRAVQLGDVQAVLLPVWIASFRGPKGPVSIFVNGQTGTVAANLPSSTGRIAAWILGATIFLLIVGMGLLAGFFLLVVIAELFL
ncbi:MAG: hypothetical protein AAFV53_30890 [Myxococcota bacterium]